MGNLGAVTPHPGTRTWMLAFCFNTHTMREEKGFERDFDRREGSGQTGRVNQGVENREMVLTFQTVKEHEEIGGNLYE